MSCDVLHTDAEEEKNYTTESFDIRGKKICLHMCTLHNQLVNQCGGSRGREMSVTFFYKQQLDPCITES